ncbi:SCO7613 C-terminal domain-containing membrane protein [Streptomyces sp. NPDC051569]|uniref:SCO7613 C-terminal domain-containing membrane protein n=1 Tax=Streptomyces sp. NPDC051569 TaxID=3365661 RepID=UPI0037B99FFE
MENVPQPARELAILDGELLRLDARRAQLLSRRSYLVGLLTRPAPPAPPVLPRPETSASGAQNALLTIGGILLAVAATAFTLVSWGRLGIGGRAVVLTAVTALALTAPAALARRGLASTAEAVAALGLLLTVLDAYAGYRVAPPGTGPLGYTAGATAVLGALWAGYGVALPRLRLPLPAAVVVAQFPLVLWSFAAGASALTTAWALLLTAAPAAVAARSVTAATRRAVGIVVVVAAGVSGGAALLTGVTLSVSAGTPLAATGPGVLLLAATALGLFAAWRDAGTGAGLACAVVAGLAAVAGAGGVLGAALPDGWAVPGYLLCGLVLSAVVATSAAAAPATSAAATATATATATAGRARLPRPVAGGLTGAAAAVTAGAVLWALPSVAMALLSGVRLIPSIWAGDPGGPRTALVMGLPWTERTTAPLVLLTAAAALATAYRWPAAVPVAAGKPWRAPALCGALALTWSAVLTLPLALGLGRPAATALLLALTAAVLAPAAFHRGSAGPAPAVTALLCAAVGSVGVALLSLGTRPATVTVLAVLTVLFAGAAVVAAVTVRPSARVVGAVLACVAAGYATALAVAVPVAAGLPAEGAALAVLAVPAAVAVPAARLRGRPVALPLEITAAGAVPLAVMLASGRASALALVLGLSGVIAAGTAVRAERRPVAGYLAATLFVLAAWVRLAASGAAGPEAYTLPVTVLALAVGALRRRRDPDASSWTAYGPGLAATLLPSLLAAWGDAHGTRPLLLGLAALAVTLVGARLRLLAPLLLGGAVLALDGLHELAPYVVQAVGALPRWLPPALAGLLLLVVGATYEQRLRDARKLRRTLGRMR